MFSFCISDVLAHFSYFPASRAPPDLLVLLKLNDAASACDIQLAIASNPKLSILILLLPYSFDLLPLGII